MEKNDLETDKERVVEYLRRLKSPLRGVKGHILEYIVQKTGINSSEIEDILKSLQTKGVIRLSSGTTHNPETKESEDFIGIRLTTRSRYITEETFSPFINTSIVSLDNQFRFCQQIKEGFQLRDGETWTCFDLAWRCLRAVRSLLLSAALYGEGIRASDQGFISAIPCYSLYYSMYHCSSALLYLHPCEDTQELLEIHHTTLYEKIRKWFFSRRVLPKSYLEQVKMLKNARELTTYFAPLGGLKASTFPEFSSRQSKLLTETAKHINYAFILSDVMGQIYWDVKQECMEKNKARCRETFDEQPGKAVEDLKKRLSYDLNIHGLKGMEDFDTVDAYVAGRWNLFSLCPELNLDYILTDTMEYFGENLDPRSEASFIKGMHDIASAHYAPPPGTRR